MLQQPALPVQRDSFGDLTRYLAGDHGHDTTLVAFARDHEIVITATGPPASAFGGWRPGTGWIHEGIKLGDAIGVGDCSGYDFSCVSAPVAQATPMTFGGVLSGSNEVPLLLAATGSVTVVLDPSAQTLAINTTFSGLTSNDVAAHIHCCAPLGTNAIVATTMPAFTGFPLGVTAGTFGQSFSLTDPTLYSTGFVTAHGGTGRRRRGSSDRRYRKRNDLLQYPHCKLRRRRNPSSVAIGGGARASQPCSSRIGRRRVRAHSSAGAPYR